MPSRTHLGQFKKGTHWRPRAPWWDKAWLDSEYTLLGKTAGEISAEHGVGDTAIHYWLKKHGIKTRTVSETRRIKRWGSPGESNPMHGVRGAAHPNWTGGSTPERQRDYSRSEVRAFLKSIRCRDSVCRRCGKRARLHVHHVKSFTAYPRLRYVAGNCVSLCGPCHHWVHSNQNKERMFL